MGKLSQDTISLFTDRTTDNGGKIFSPRSIDWLSGIPFEVVARVWGSSHGGILALTLRTCSRQTRRSTRALTLESWIYVLVWL